MAFIAGHRNVSDNNKETLWFVYHGQRLLVRAEENGYVIPGESDLECIQPDLGKEQFFGTMDQHPCVFSELQKEVKLTKDLEFIGLRKLFSGFDEDHVQASGTAKQLLHWDMNHRYCGRCGHRTENKEGERAKICPECGLINYTRLSPAIIVAVVRDGKILLASSQRFPGKFYSVLAGFVEPGETLEDCVKREVHEEVGITVKNIRYFGSQPWPFPDSLMVGFTSEYDEGDMVIDDSEIADAGWYSPEELPSIPPRISIARQLIDWFTEEYCNNNAASQ
jgi:NAD+ diphosphatase